MTLLQNRSTPDQRTTTLDFPLEWSEGERLANLGLARLLRWLMGVPAAAALIIAATLNIKFAVTLSAHSGQAVGFGLAGLALALMFAGLPLAVPIAREAEAPLLAKAAQWLWSLAAIFTILCGLGYAL